MSASEIAKIKEVITEYFQLAKTKEIEKIDSFLDQKFTKFGDSPPYDRRDFERALMLEQLQFASISDYDFKINDLKIEVKNDSALATFMLESTATYEQFISIVYLDILKDNSMVTFMDEKEYHWIRADMNVSEAGVQISIPGEDPLFYDVNTGIVSTVIK